MRRHAAGATGAAAVVLALSLLPLTPAQATPDSVTSQLETARKATEKYKDPAVAVADGYVATDFCYGGPLGVMGFHYFNPERAKTGATDVEKPPLLVYQPGPDGTRVLAALEWFQPDADQDLSTDEDRPWLFGVPFNGPMEGHEPGMPRHYDLHAWIYKKNPQGTFAPYNPAGTCAGAPETNVTAVPSAAPTHGAGHAAHTAEATPAPAQVEMMPVGGAATGAGVTAEEQARGWYFGLVAAGASLSALIFALGARRRRTC